MTLQERPQPLISVVMPVYNTARFLRAALDSVLNQTYRNIQFIVVDDCSTDGSAEILASYDDPRLEVFRMEENSHVCAARNEGARHVRGDYVAIMDSDDIWRPQKLEKQMAVLAAHPDCGACFTWADIIDENGTLCNEENRWFYEVYRQPNRSRREWLLRLLHGGNCLCNPSALMPAAVLRAVGETNLTLVQLQDYELWIRLLSCKPIHVLPEALVCYRRVRENNASVSAGSIKNRIRTSNEEIFICTHFFDHMSDADFRSLFCGDFRNPDASSPEELACERTFLLRQAFCAPEPYLAGMQRLLSAPETAEVLRTRYGYTPKAFYAENGVKRYFDRGLQARQREALENCASVVFFCRDGSTTCISLEKDSYVYERDASLSCDVRIPDGACSVEIYPVQTGACVVSGLSICADGTPLPVQFSGDAFGEHRFYVYGQDTLRAALPEGAARLTIQMRRTVLNEENEYLLGFGADALPAILQQEKLLHRQQISRMEQAQSAALAALRQEKENLEGECRQLREKENRLLAELAAIKGSRAWKLTQGLRRLAGRADAPEQSNKTEDN